MKKEDVKRILNDIEEDFENIVNTNDKNEFQEIENNIIRKQKELDNIIDEIENDVDIATNSENIKVEETIKIDKKSNKNRYKILVLLALISIFSIVGIYIFKSLPTEEKVENIEVANPNNFRIEDLGDDEDKVISQQNDEASNLANEVKENEENSLKDVNDLTVEDSNNDKFDKEQEELDRAIAEIEGDRVKNTQVLKGSTTLGYINRYESVKKDTDEKENSYAKENTNTSKTDNVIRITLKNRLQDAETPYEVKQGSILPAILLTEMNTDLPGAILAQIREDVYDSATGKFLLIPKGSKLYGRYESNISKGQVRIFAVWDRLTLPNGKYVDLTEMQTADALGNSGLKDRVNNHTLEIIGKAILSSLINLGDTLSSGVSLKVGGINVGLSGQAKENEKENPIRKATGKMLNDEVNRQPTLTVRKGYRFNVIVNQDLILDLYK